ncbi:hypothetical protein EMMF5_001274 [Cystobasidiomycetes sp. EMM_F5]
MSRRSSPPPLASAISEQQLADIQQFGLRAVLLQQYEAEKPQREAQLAAEQMERNKAWAMNVIRRVRRQEAVKTLNEAEDKAIAVRIIGDTSRRAEAAAMAGVISTVRHNSDSRATRSVKQMRIDINRAVRNAALRPIARPNIGSLWKMKLQHSYTLYFPTGVVFMAHGIDVEYEGPLNVGKDCSVNWSATSHFPSRGYIPVNGIILVKIGHPVQLRPRDVLAAGTILVLPYRTRYVRSP